MQDLRFCVLIIFVKRIIPDLFNIIALYSSLFTKRLTKRILVRMILPFHRYDVSSDDVFWREPIFCQTTEYSFVRKLQRKQKKTQKKTETFFSKRLIAIRAFEVSYILQNLSSLHTCTTLKTMSLKEQKLTK